MSPLPYILGAAQAAPHLPTAEPSGVTPPVSSPLEPLLFAFATLGVAVLAIGIVMCLARMLKGPHLADRVLAADTLSLHVVALVVVLAIRFESAMFFDAALVVAILGFASTVAFSQYIYAHRGRRGSTADEPPPPPPTPEVST